MGLFLRALAAVWFAVLATPLGAAESVRLEPLTIDHLLKLDRIEGRAIDVRQLRRKPVLVSFFASWCPPCNAEFEHMNLLYQAHAAEGLTVIAINLFEDFSGFADDGKRLDRFLGRHRPVFPVLRGTDDTAKLFGNVERIPTVFVFGRDGRPLLHFIHGKGAKKTNPGMDELREAVRNALGVSAAQRSPFLPDPADSVTKRSYLNLMAVNRP